MLKKISYSFSLLLPLLFLFFCTRFDETTGLGKDIVHDIDSSLTAVNQNFKTVESVIIDSAFSIPDPNDTMFGIHTSVISVGTKENVTASGFVEYKIDHNILNTFKINTSDTNNLEIDSISLQLNISGKDSSLPSNINVFACLNADSINRSPASRMLQVATLNLSSDSAKYSGSSSNALLKDSVKNAILDIKNRLKICDTCKIEPVYLRFYLYSSDSCNLVHLASSPLLNFSGKKGTASISVNITPSYRNFVAIEKNADSLSKIPISTSASQRTAVFKLDISNLWKTLDTIAFYQILSAGFSITAKTYKNVDKSHDTLRYHLSHQLFGNNSTIHKQKQVGAIYSVSADSTGAPSDTFMLKGLENNLKRLSSINPRPSTVYLYIQLFSANNKWNELVWNSPKFKAILTSLE